MSTLPRKPTLSAIRSRNPPLGWTKHGLLPGCPCSTPNGVGNLRQATYRCSSRPDDRYALTADEVNAAT